MKSYFIRYQKQHANNARTIVSSILLYLAGLLIGYLCGQLFRNSLYLPVKDTYEGLLAGISTTEIQFFPLFLLCLKQQCKNFLLLLFFSCTNVWLFYLSGYLLYRGFTGGLLLLFCTMLHGISGIWGFFCFLMPQALLYIPVYLCLIHKLHSTRDGNQKGIPFLHEIPSILLLLLFLLAGCILESTLNLPLLRWYHGL